MLANADLRVSAQSNHGDVEEEAAAAAAAATAAAMTAQTMAVLSSKFSHVQENFSA